jgi:hypothetical protein
MKGVLFLEHLELAEEPCLQELAAFASCINMILDIPITDNMINNIMTEVMSAIL